MPGRKIPMEVLRQNKIITRMLGIYFEDETSFVSSLFAYFTNILVILITASHTAASVVYIFHSGAPIVDVLYAVDQFAVDSSILFIYFTLLHGKRDLTKLTKAIQTLAEQREC